MSRQIVRPIANPRSAVLGALPSLGRLLGHVPPPDIRGHGVGPRPAPARQASAGAASRRFKGVRPCAVLNDRRRASVPAWRSVNACTREALDDQRSNDVPADQCPHYRRRDAVDQPVSRIAVRLAGSRPGGCAGRSRAGGVVTGRVTGCSGSTVTGSPACLISRASPRSSE